jgi:hypothetical protein
LKLFDHSGSELGLVVIFCVLTIFLFPAVQGPYSAVHGPATALLAAQAALRVRSSIAQAATKRLNRRAIPTFFLFFYPWLSDAADFGSARPLECDYLLRC